MKLIFKWKYLKKFGILAILIIIVKLLFRVLLDWVLISPSLNSERLYFEPHEAKPKKIRVSRLGSPAFS